MKGIFDPIIEQIEKLITEQRMSVKEAGFSTKVKPQSTFKRDSINSNLGHYFGRGPWSLGVSLQAPTGCFRRHPSHAASKRVSSRTFLLTQRDTDVKKKIIGGLPLLGTYSNHSQQVLYS